MHFKELNTSGCNILDVILYAVSHIPKRSSGKVTLNVVTNTLQTAVCEKLCKKTVQPVFADEILCNCALYMSLLTWLK